MKDPQEIAQALCDQPVWSAVVGPLGQYALSLELGEQQRRPVRLANPRLSFVKRTFEGAFGLLVECPWRIDAEHGVVASAFDVFDPDEAVVGEHAAFDGATVRRVHLDVRTGDLMLALSNDLTLRCLVLETQKRSPERINWSLSTPDVVLTAGPSGRLVVRSRAEAEGAFRRMIRALDGGGDDLVSRLAKSRGMAAVPPLVDETPDDLVVDEPEPGGPTEPSPR